MKEKQVIEIDALDPAWAKQATDREVFALLPAPGGDARADNHQILYKGDLILVTRVLLVYLRTSQIWELYLISGKTPKVKRLSAAQGHISIFRRFEVRCEMSSQGSLLEREATVTISPHCEAFEQPDPFHIRIKE